MRIVEIRRRRPEDGEVESLARVYAGEPGAPATWEVLLPEMAQGLEMLIADGVADALGRMLYLSDGEAFLAALPEYYRASRFWAEEVPSGET